MRQVACSTCHGQGFVMTREGEDEFIWETIFRIADERGLEVMRVLSPSRTKALMDARVAIYIALRDRGLSLKQIGYIVGRDHSTITQTLQKAGYKNRLDRGHSLSVEV